MKKDMFLVEITSAICLKGHLFVKDTRTAFVVLIMFRFKE